MNNIAHCPGCGLWIDNKAIGKCHYCGFDWTTLDPREPPEPIPDHCDEHGKYEGIGVPKTDCLVCWKMHKGNVDGKVKELEAVK